MELLNTVNRKRITASPYNFDQTVESAFYIASKRKKPIRVLQDDDNGSYKIISDLTMPIKGTFHEVSPDGKLFLGNNANIQPSPKDLYEMKKREKLAPKIKKPISLDFERWDAVIETIPSQVTFSVTPASAPLTVTENE